MALLDKVPGDLNLYIGGSVVSPQFSSPLPCPTHPLTHRSATSLFTLRRKLALQTSGITHILTLLRQPLDDKLFEGFTHRVIEVDDVDDENLLEFLPECVGFIQRGLEEGGGVLVHW